MTKRKSAGSTSGELALSADQVRRLLRSCWVLEQEALLAVACTLGIRRGDIVRLRWGNVDLDAGWVKYHEKKKGDWHTAPISGHALKVLAQLQDVQDGGSPWVWPSDHHLNESGHITSKTAYNWLQSWCKEAGIEPRPFHALRATAIKLAQDRGWTEEQAARLVNDRVETIRDHYTTPSRQEMEDVAEEAPII